ncbi:biopolymer transporter ExbD [candidate division KSB1 bacterium]|nr:biopolymer transporter ExbD [candidate division KSB1 bacterium]MBL7094743.1 biopolymer transporter ExbD [candidate division KSB1 bacterium]
MAFKKFEERRDFELPTLIDVVFLLLIFFLATISVSTPGQQLDHKKPQEIPNLPEAKGNEIFSQNEVLETLLIQVSHGNKDDATSPKIAYVLWPSEKGSHTLRLALQTSKNDPSTFREFPADFLTMSDEEFQRCPPCSLIAAHIDSYKTQYFSEPSLSNCIEIRAEQDIEFKIVNYIMDLCSVYGDTIPRLVFRTLYETKVQEQEEQVGF